MTFFSIVLTTSIKQVFAGWQKLTIFLPRLYGLALNELIAKIVQIWNLTWSFLFLNAIRISKVPGHYINRKMQYSTARTAVLPDVNKRSQKTDILDDTFCGVWVQLEWPKISWFFIFHSLDFFFRRSKEKYFSIAWFYILNYW